MIHPYASPEYAHSLAATGLEPLDVPAWGTPVFRRRIGEGEDYDAIGGYPVAILGAAADLRAGLDQLRQAGLVSVVLVADPVLRPSDAALNDAFDTVRPFKTHYLCDRRTGELRYSRHHRYELSRASASVRRIDLACHLDGWNRLYGELVARHGITGTAAFSGPSFQRLCAVPGLVSFGAFLDDTLVGCHHWFCDGKHAHSHLAATGAAGRASGAGYRLYDAAIRHFAAVETIDLGGGAGLAEDAESGLSRFKRGFANASAWAYLCGAVLDPERYDRWCAATGTAEASYFPAYRCPAAHAGGENP